MTTELAVREQATTTALATVTITEAQSDLVKRTIAPDATPDELQLFFHDCQRQGVHPLDRMIHFTKRGKGGKYTPITSIDFMRQRAADSGEYAGNDDAVFTGKPGTDDFTATVIVWRLVQGQRCAFSATARWKEYKPAPGPSGNGDLMWKKMEHIMLAKCAEALALRKAFPKQTAKLYEWAEIAQAGAFQNEQPMPVATIQRPQSKPTNPTVASGATPTTQAAPKTAQTPPTDPTIADLSDDLAESVESEPGAGMLVTTVATKEGSNAKGPWTLFIVSCDDGKEYVTIDEKIGAALQECQQTGKRVKIDFEEVERNGRKSLRIKSIL